MDWSTLWKAADCQHAISGASDDEMSVQSDGTGLNRPYICRRRRKATPHRAPMYSDSGSCNDYEMDCYQKRGKPARLERHHATTSSDARLAPAAPPTAAAALKAAAKARPAHSAPAGSRGGGKKANPSAGPCDNCGTYSSPQWRHGSKSKPTVCNACGIRWLRTGSFEKAVDKRRSGAALSGSGAMSGLQAKRSKADSDYSSMEEDGEQVEGPHIPNSSGHPADSRPASRAGTWLGTAPHLAAADHVYGMNSNVAAVPGTIPRGEWLQARMPGTSAAAAAASMMQQQLAVPVQPNQLGPNESPASTSTAHSHGCAPPSPLLLGPAVDSSSAQAILSSNAAHSSSSGAAAGAVAGSSYTGQVAQQQQQQKGRAPGAQLRASRLGPSPLSVASDGLTAGRPTCFGGMTAAGAAAAAAHGAACSVAAGLLGVGNTMRPGSAAAGITAAAAPTGTSPVSTAAAGTAGTSVDPKLLAIISRLAGVLGSVDAAIAFVLRLEKGPAPGGAAGVHQAGTASDAGATSGDASL